MPKFTIETTYRLPFYRHRVYDAATVADACRGAVEDQDFEGERPDYETPGETYVTGIWVGEDAAYKGAALPVPPNFDEPAQQKADHFDALVAVLAEAAQSTGLSSADFELWLPRAQSALAKAAAIRDDRAEAPLNPPAIIEIEN